MYTLLSLGFLFFNTHTPVELIVYNSVDLIANVVGHLLLLSYIYIYIIIIIIPIYQLVFTSECHRQIFFFHPRFFCALDPGFHGNIYCFLFVRVCVCGLKYLLEKMNYNVSTQTIISHFGCWNAGLLKLAEAWT